MILKPFSFTQIMDATREPRGGVGVLIILARIAIKTMNNKMSYFVFLKLNAV
jgi:hypothetical protein